MLPFMMRPAIAAISLALLVALVGDIVGTATQAAMAGGMRTALLPPVYHNTGRRFHGSGG